MSNAISKTTAAHVDPIVRAAGAATSHPHSAAGTYAGHLAIHGTLETGTSPGGVLRALVALGVSRGPWKGSALGVDCAELSDLDGEVRGSVLYSATGACATLWDALSRPMACFAA